ncbi:MAG: ArsR/SmtB family transcription factor [Candidatus Freyarchaeota archaeon]
MKVEVIRSIISRLDDGPMTVNELAKSLGIGWGTCEAYLSALKFLGVVEEIRSKRGRIYRLREKRKKWLFPHRKRIPQYIKITSEKPVEDKVVDLT